jgi:DedD protein
MIGGYFYYTQSDQSLNSGQTDEDIAVLEPDAADMANGEMAETPAESESTTEETGTQDSNQQPTAGQTVSESEEEAPEENTISGTAPEDQPLYGLRGNIVESANNGYSIVLHSFTNEANARETAERLRNDNYRVIIVPRNVQGETVWRVSVGQFASLDEAQRATNQLPPPYNQRNFIHRIQIN